MSINRIDDIANNYACELDAETLKDIINGDINIVELQEWVNADYPDEKFDDDDLFMLKISLMNSAKAHLEDYKLSISEEIESSIYNIFEDKGMILENHEIVAVLVKAAANYLTQKEEIPSFMYR